MTTWVEEPRGGRARGPRGVARAWLEVMVRPGRFFRTGVAPGDQAPGLVFAVGVALLYVGARLAFVPGAVPDFAGQPALSGFLALLAVALFVAPAVLHLTAALTTVLLMVGVRERAGISETVQVIAYAAAPCALAGLPVPGLRVLCGLYGGVLLAVGLAVVHRTSLPRALAVGALPAALVFGYGFNAFGAAAALLG
ncbi:MAG: YIP1 family protein [Salinigranum sp.]